MDEAPGFRIWHEQPLRSIPFHWHDQVEITYAVGGSLTYLLAGSVVRLPPGRLSIFWTGTPHSVAGFGSISRFYEAFKTISGQTPRQYRLVSGMR